MTEVRQAETLEPTKKLEIHKKKRIRINKAANHFGFYNFFILWSYHKKNPRDITFRTDSLGTLFCLVMHACTAYLRDTVEGDCALGRK